MGYFSWQGKALSSGGEVGPLRFGLRNNAEVEVTGH